MDVSSHTSDPLLRGTKRLSYRVNQGGVFEDSNNTIFDEFTNKTMKEKDYLERKMGAFRVFGSFFMQKSAARQEQLKLANNYINLNNNVQVNNGAIDEKESYLEQSEMAPTHVE